MNCAAVGEHWDDVEKVENIPLCRKHRIILRSGGKIHIKAHLKTSAWTWFHGSIKP